MHRSRTLIAAAFVAITLIGAIGCGEDQPVMAGRKDLYSGFGRRDIEPLERPAPPQPTPPLYAAALTPDEQMLFDKLQQVTGRTLLLDAGLMAAAQRGDQSPPSAKGWIYSNFKGANLWGVNQSAVDVVGAADPNLYPSKGQPWSHVGVGAQRSGDRLDLFYLIAVVS